MKDDYLKRLDEELKDAGFENTDAIIEKYSKRYDFGLESGLTDEEIEEKLGDPKDIVSNYSEKSEYEYKESDTSLKINVSTVCDDILFEESIDDEIHVYLEDIDESAYEISNSNRGVDIKYIAKKFFGLNRRKSGLITIAIPNNTSFNKILLQTTNGDFKSKIDLDTKFINIEMVSGDAEFKNIKAKEIKLHVVSGDFEAKDINTSSLNISTVSGDVEIEYLLANDLKVDTVSGDINIHEASYGINVKASSISGSIMIDGKKYKSFTKKIKEAFKSEN